MKNLITFLSILALLSGCNTSSSEKSVKITGTQALIWSQMSAEAEALYIQGYNVASQIVKESNKISEKPLAVVLDIDETVLDNSPFNVNMVKNGLDYSEDIWADWCERREAIPLPGALAFTRLADSIGIEVFYISNRRIELLDATLDNLQQYGFPNAGSEHVLLKETTSSKDVRRAKVREQYDILLLLGDNLGDFEGIFDDRTNEFGKPAVRKYSEEFGNRFIVFPNPMYGSWERGAFPDGFPSQQEALKALRSY